MVLIPQFLDTLDLLSVGTEQNRILICEITKEEQDEAISRLKTSKMPRADGFPAELYKTFR